MTHRRLSFGGARRSGFTLFEILIAASLTGMMMTLALAPVVYTVRRVVDTQRVYTDELAMTRTMSFIGRDASSAIRTAQVQIRIDDHRTMNDADDDVLMIMSSSPAVQREASGTIVYKLELGGGIRTDIIPGLYRWILRGKLPDDSDADPSSLKAEDGQLVLPGVTSFRVEACRGDEYEKEYRGALPPGIFVQMRRGGQQGSGDDKDVESIEDVIVFP